MNVSCSPETVPVLGLVLPLAALWFFVLWCDADLKAYTERMMRKETADYKRHKARMEQIVLGPLRHGLANPNSNKGQP